MIGLNPRYGRAVSNASTDPDLPVRKDQTMHSFMDAKLMAKLLRQGLAERQLNWRIATAWNWLHDSSASPTGIY
jgi:hypothetical protein